MVYYLWECWLCPVVVTLKQNSFSQDLWDLLEVCNLFLIDSCNPIFYPVLAFYGTFLSGHGYGVHARPPKHFTVCLVLLGLHPAPPQSVWQGLCIIIGRVQWIVTVKYHLQAVNGGAAYTQGLLVTSLPFVSLAIMVFFSSRKWFSEQLRHTAIP